MFAYLQKKAALIHQRGSFHLIRHFLMIQQVIFLEPHTLLLSLEGALLAFGHNRGGLLGLGHENDQITPAMVP